MKKLTLLLIMLTSSSIAYSQITSTSDLSRDQKIEIVSTLEAYPIVLRELDLYVKMFNECEFTVQILKEQIKIADNQILILSTVSENQQKQIDLLKKQLKQKGRNVLVPALVGVVGGLVIGVVF